MNLDNGWVRAMMDAADPRSPDSGDYLGQRVVGGLVLIGVILLVAWLVG